MSDCTYKLTLPDGQERTIIGKAAMKAFLVEEGVGIFFPNGLMGAFGAQNQQAATGGKNAGTSIYADGTRPLGAVAAGDDAGAARPGDAELRGTDGQQAGSGAGGATDDAGLPKARGRGNRAAGNDSAATRAAGAGGRRGRGGLTSKQEKRQAQLQIDAAQAPDLHLSTDQQIEAASPVNTPAVDFVIDGALELGRGSETVKFRDNVAAIRALKAIEAEGRRASPEEQRILARYVGWGGLKNAFRVAGAKDGAGVAKGWESRVAEIEELLTAAELRAARNSTTAAHYTSETVVNGVWKAVQRLGFRGGAVLEPSMGTGNFVGLMPAAVRGNAQVVGVEYDSLTARIAQQLYPNATVLHSGFQELPMPTNQFALAIGNPPFGKESLYFRSNPAVAGMSIHNQFFVASLDSVAPDGIMGMVVSRYLMDAQNNTARLAMAERAEFLGAIRLPDTAFQENARTEVVTDMVFFRKRRPGEVEIAKEAIDHLKKGSTPIGAADQAVLQEMQRIAQWTKTEKVVNFADSGEDIGLNSYFLRNPGMVVGRMDASSTMQARVGLNVKLDDPSTLPQRLDAAIALLPEIAPKNDVQERTAKNFELMATSLRLAVRRAEPGGISITPEGRLKLVVDMDGGDMGKSVLTEITLDEKIPYAPDYQLGADGKWQRVTDKLGADGKPVKQVNPKTGKPSMRNEKELTTFESAADIPANHQWGAERIAMVRAMLPIRDLMKRQLMLESSDSPEGMLRVNRKRLNDAYDAFVKAHGPLHGAKSQHLAMTMPDGALALAAERVVYQGKKVVGHAKADILERRVVEPTKPVEAASSIADAVAISLGESGSIDVDRIAQLMKTDAAGAERLLSEGENPRAFFDPELHRWESADAYLSGLVRRKLLAAKSAGLEGNIKALEAVQPEDWDSSQITPTMGGAWIPPRIYADFLKHLGYEKAHVSYSALTNSFTVSAEGKAAPQWTLASSSMAAQEMAERTMNSKAIVIQHTNSEGKVYVDEEATAEAQMKGREIFNEFQDWAYADESRRAELVRIFNEKFNTRVTRQRDGSHLKLPGKVPDAIIKMRRHQKNAIWRGITDRAVLYDHVVGAGKTYTAIARIMERRRMGLSRKPMVVVPNHLVEQWANDVIKLYPGANILAAGKADFEKASRRRLFARIASGDYDMVIMGHSSFGFISIDPVTEERYLDEELRAATAAIDQAQKAAEEEGYSGYRKPFGVAEAERLVKRITERLAKLRGGKRDRLLTFEEMGVDDLTIDESHEFKNLAYTSRLTKVSGMGNKTGSAKATDLNLKLRSLNDRTGTSVAFLTGTPISNSAAEMYLILKNLAPKELKEMGMENFDAWRTLYASVGTAYEPTESGSLKEVARLGREWTNMRSLMDLYYSVSDAVTMDDIKSAFAEENPGSKFPIPEVRSAVEGEGDREMVVVKPTAEQREQLRDIVAGFDGLPGIQDPKERNIERLRLMDRARKVSLDVRAVDPFAKVADPSAGKIGAVVNNVARIYRQWSADKGTQIVFLDRSVPTAKGDDKRVKEYDDLAQRRLQAMNNGDDAEVSRIEDALEKFSPSEMEELRNALAGGWNAYAEIKNQLVAQGIPANEIRFVQEANTDEQKMALFDLVKSGEVRVLIGSTPRMGAGTNVQDRLVGLHHADVTWKPSDIEQREGRIVRQGNLFATPTIDGKPNPLYRPDFVVDVMAYATEMTVDAKMWSLNATKLKAINGVRKYDGSFNMEFEDEESASMAEMAALATGNPLMIERVVLDGEVKKLEMAQRSFGRRISAMRERLANATRLIEDGPASIDALNTFAQAVEQGRNAVLERSSQRTVTVQGKAYGTLVQAQDAAAAAIAEIRGSNENARFSIDVNGVKLTQILAVQDAIESALGNPELEVAVDGEVHIATYDAGKAIAVKAKDKGDAYTIDGIVLNGIAVEVDVAPDRYGKAGTKAASFVALNGAGQAMASYHTTFGDGKSPDMSPQLARSGIEKLKAKLEPSLFQEQAQRTGKQIESAKRDIAELRTQAAQVFPQAQELEDKRARLSEVVSILSSQVRQEQNADGSANSEASFSRSDQAGAMLGNEAGVNWVEAADQSAAAQVAVAIRASLKNQQGNYDYTIVTPELQRSSFGDSGWTRPKNLTDALSQRVRGFESAFGRRVVFVRANRGAPSFFNGFILPKRDPNTIYINIDANVNLMSILGHEFYEGLVVTNPELHAWFVNQAVRQLNGGALQAYSDKLAALGDTQDGSGRFKELLADFAGDALADPEFRRSLERADQGKFRQLIRVFRNFLIQTLGKMRARITGQGLMGDDDLGSNRYFKDVQALRDALRDAIQKSSAGGSLTSYLESGGAMFSLSADQANPDIRFSRATAQSAPAPATWQAPSLEDTKHRTAWDNIVYTLQDKMVDVKRVVQAIRETGQQIEDDQDVYLQEELYHARVSHKSQEFVQKELDPMVKLLADRGVELADFESYLHARHAPEANRVMMERNPTEQELQDRMDAIYAQIEPLEAFKSSAAPKEQARLQRLIDQGIRKIELLTTVQPWRGTEEDRQKLSGMSNQEATAIMAGLSQEERQTMEEAARQFDAIVQKNRQEMVDYDLENQDTVDGWGNMFQFYVPLMREDEGNAQGTGQGFSVKGREVKSRTGSTRKVVDIVANLAMQRERAIVRGEKNRVSQALVGLAVANPNPDFWRVGGPDLERKYDPRTGTVKTVTNPNYKNLPNVVTAKVRENGAVKEVAVVFNEDDNRAKRMAETLKNLDGQTLEGLYAMTAPITRYLASMSTQYNPIFGITNLARDLQGAMVNLAGTPLADQKSKIAWLAKNAIADIYRAARADRRNEAHSGEWTQWWDMFQEDGGPTGYRDIFQDSADRTKAIADTMNPDAWMESAFGKVATANGLLKDPAAAVAKGKGWVFDWLSDYNLAMENGIRVSTYRAAVESGMSRQRAASLAKNITVNFNRKGQMALKTGALYAFFNAAVQGTARIGQALVTMEPGKPKTMRLSPLGKKVVYGGIMLGALQALALAAAGFDDENPPDFVRERNTIIPIGGGKFITIPMPLGLHVFPGIGRHLTEFALSGGKDPNKRAIKMLGMLTDSFYPLGSAGMSMQTLVPTALDPLAALLENRDYAGRPIARESMDKNVPGHELTRTTATWFSKGIAEGINWIAGGDKYVAGAMSPTPDQIDYLIGQATGGVGREVLKAVQTGQTMATGEELPMHKVPLLGRFFGAANGSSSQSSSFYAKVDEAKRIDRRIDGLREDGQRQQAQTLERSNQFLLAKARIADRQVTRLRREKRKLLDDGAPREKVREVERKMADAMRRFNEATAK